MLEKVQQSEYLPTFIKVIIPAVVAVAIKIAVEMKKTNSKVSFLNVVLSMITGVGGAWLLSRPIQEYCHETYLPAGIALIAIISDKIAEFLIYKFKFDTFLMSLIDNIYTAIKDNLTKKNE